MTQLFCLQWSIISITIQSTAGKTSPKCGPAAAHFFTQSLSILLTRYNQNNYFTFVKIQFLYMLEAVNSGSILLNLKQQSIHRLLFVLSFLKHSPASKVSTCHWQLELSLHPKAPRMEILCAWAGKRGNCKRLRNSHLSSDLSRWCLVLFTLLHLKHGNYSKRETEGRGSLMPSYPVSKPVVNHRVMKFPVLESFICLIGWQVDTRHWCIQWFFFTQAHGG